MKTNLQLEASAALEAKNYQQGQENAKNKSVILNEMRCIWLNDLIVSRLQGK